MRSAFAEHDDRWISHRCVLFGEGQPSGFLIDLEHGDIVCSLIAAVQELTGGIEIEASRIVAASPLVTNKCERSVSPDGKDADTVVQSVTSVNETSVRRDKNL